MIEGEGDPAPVEPTEDVDVSERQARLREETEAYRRRLAKRQVRGRG